LLATWGPRVPGLLVDWGGERRQQLQRLQPCLCDVWHDHVLFEGDKLTGVVDYASMRMDVPATDIARLVGSLVKDDEEGWRTALAAYREGRSLSEEDGQLAWLLDRTGTIMALATWLRRWTHLESSVEDEPLVSRRLEGLIQRVERWSKFDFA
jgi:Ser/Thr protein kinase RdoA (MazF antagonist)